MSSTRVTEPRTARDDASAAFDAAVPALRDVQDRQRDAVGARALARARYLQTLRERSAPRKPSTTRWLTAAALAAAAPALAFACWFSWRARSAPSIAFAVNGSLEGKVGAELVARDTALPLRFSDGSEVELQAAPAGEAAIRVTELRRDGAHVALHAGRAKVRVVHRENTRWLFAAGPYQVRVVGTGFDLAWDPDGQRFSIAMTEGHVEVRGGLLPAPTPVVAGQTLEVDQASASWRVMPSVTPATPATTALEGDRPGPSTSEEVGTPDQPSSTPANAGSAARRDAKRERPAWSELATAGKYGDALAAAEAEGFAKICNQGALPDLLALAQAARFAKSPARSRQALLAVRTRFAKEPQAQVATFLLGRLALEGREYAEAERRFRDYLRDAPGGALAAEAHGRLLETLEDGGHHERARDEATQYLERFPHGSYATMAKKILRQ